MSKVEHCPRCGGPLERDEVDIGVGVQTGPAGCPSCFWIEGEPVGRLPEGSLGWAANVVRSHPEANDDYAVIAAIISSGVQISPAVTLGELRLWVKAARETEHRLAQYEEQGRRLIEERDAIRAQLRERDALHAGPQGTLDVMHAAEVAAWGGPEAHASALARITAETAQAPTYGSPTHTDEIHPDDLENLKRALQAGQAGQTGRDALVLISPAEPVDGKATWRVDPPISIEEMQTAIVDGIKMHLRQDGTVVVFSFEDAKHVARSRNAPKPWLTLGGGDAPIVDILGGLRSGPLIVKQFSPFTRIPLDTLDMCTDFVTFDLKTGAVLSRVPWACCTECRGVYEQHDPKCSRYQPKEEE